ncbi:MAG: alcohol dehydrogenase catalytic domain-containing protein [Clostridiales Family XIII bacterium]|jgi:(R,R)-butanediol dehydrogenase/meso-butanediol dehydrogenase/diacetyl reductase/L-iditol 2-dehydrogenase|nr:alcohol dehydrogenase catalytic domain-containing protein [Clostridiales Family XIII bacterium]
MKVVSAVKIGNMKDPDPARRGRVAVLDVPESPLGDEDVRIKVAYCAICGSDPHVVGGIFGWEPPFGLGHEASGVVVELGAKATKRGLKVGDRVAGNFRRYCGTCYYCRNGQEQFCENASEAPAMAEYMVWHESQIIRLPGNISLKNGCMLEPVSIGVRVTDKTNMRIGGRVAVSGGGPIGLITLQLLKMFGATSLTMIEPNPQRRALAEKFGADYLIDPSDQNVEEAGLRITDGFGYDLVLEVSGVPSAAESAVTLVANAGRLIFVAMYPNDYEMPLNIYRYCYKKEIEITGTFVAPYAFPRSARILGRMDLDDFTNTVYDIDDAEEAFRAHLSGNHPKVLIRCNKDLY